MRKLLLVTGLVMLFVGIILMSSSNLSSQKTEVSWDRVKVETDKWEITTNFEAGDVVKLDFSPAADWIDYLEPATQDVPLANKAVYIDVTGPSGNATRFEVILVTDYSPPQLSLFNISIVNSNGFGGPISQDLTSKEKMIAGEIMQTGQYTGEVVVYSPLGGGPPASFIFYKQRVETFVEWPYAGFLYPGAAVFALGVALFVLSFRRKKRQMLRKKRASRGT